MRIVTVAVIALAVVTGCTEEEATIGSVDSGVTSDTGKPDTGAPDTASETAADTGVDSGPEDTGPADTGTDTFDVCSTAVGMLCNDSQPCPDTWRCYGVGAEGFCAPFDPECGGFLNKMCAGGRVCLRAGGSTLGYCATEEEKPCICSKPDAGRIDGC